MKFMLFLFCFSASLFTTACVRNSSSPEISPIEISTVQETLDKTKEATEIETKSISGIFPSIGLVGQSTLRFTVYVATEYGVAEVSHAHCILYAENDDYSFLAMPKHVIPETDTTDMSLYLYKVEDRYGKKSDFFQLYMCSWMDNHDAAMVKVEKLKGFHTFSNNLITRDYSEGDSVCVLTEFNSRGYKGKWGKFSGEGVEMSSIYCEPGDSGALVVGRFGVVGYAVGIASNGQFLAYEKIQLFEALYIDMVTN